MSTAPDLTQAAWRKSSYSDGNGGACIEVADFPGVVPVRDSKVPAGPVLVVDHSSWAAFINFAKSARI